MEPKYVLTFQRAALSSANNKGMDGRLPISAKGSLLLVQGPTMFPLQEDSGLVGPGLAHLPDIEAKGAHLTPAVN